FAPRRGVTGGAVAFDTGPGVAVVDAVTRRIDPAASFDAGGERARRGKPSRKGLEALLADPYFAAPPPTSTGRERRGPDYPPPPRPPGHLPGATGGRGARVLGHIPPA